MVKIIDANSKKIKNKSDKKNSSKKNKKKSAKNIKKKGSKKVSEKIRTGIMGLDKLLFGGLPKGNIISLSGTSGSGKTIFSLQYLCYGAKDYDEPGVFISLEEEPQRLIKTCNDFGWDAEKLINENKLIIIKTPLYKFNVLKDIIRENVSRINAKRLVIDPGAMIELFFERPIETRKAVVELGLMLKKMNCTCIVTNEENKFVPNKTDYSSDGIIYLFYTKVMNQFMRMLAVVKMRNTKHSEKIHPLRFTQKGLEVMSDEEVFQDIK